MKPATAVKTALRLNALQKDAQSAAKDAFDAATNAVSAALPLAQEDGAPDETAMGQLTPSATGQPASPREPLHNSPRVGAPGFGLGCEAQSAAIPGGIASICNEADRPNTGCERREGVVQRFPCFAVVGHTNAGKTSLLRTLTRRVDFGAVSAQPGATRHAEAIVLRFDGRVAARFIDTPGLEDSVALLRYLNSIDADSRPARIAAFLRGPEARASFEQEAKVLRALLEQADAALLVIDTREPVLPKFRAEVEILACCAKPIMPVLNFVRDAASRCGDWHQMLREAGLHAQAEFDAVAPFNGSEQQLYTDLSTLLPARRQQLAAIVQALAAQASQLRGAACRAIASSLIDVAAMRRALPAQDFADPARQQTHVRAFQDQVRRHVRRAVDDLLAVYAFRAGDAELAEIPSTTERWEDDLFNPDLLARAGKRLGLGALIGAGIGAVADVALAGLSLGAATTLGATLGAALSGGWQPLWRKLENAFNGVRELTASDPLLLLLADRLLLLARALEQRGHAAQHRLQVGGAQADEGSADADLRDVVSALAPARAHPEWERGHSPGAPDAGRQALEIELARGLEDGLAPVGEAV